MKNEDIDKILEEELQNIEKKSNRGSYEDIVEIIWLKDPMKYKFLREDTVETLKHKGPIDKDKTKLVGYSNAEKEGKWLEGIYRRKIWFLKEEDEYSEGKRTEKILSEIPDHVKIVKAYKIKKVVPEYSRNSKRAKLRALAKKERRPFIAIHKGTEYGTFEFDMTTTDYDLKHEAVNEMKKILQDFIYGLNKKEKEFIFPKGRLKLNISPASGLFPKIRIFECRLLAKRFMEIISDKNNWQHIHHK